MLRELGELARQEGEADQARFDERWDRLAAGTLTAEEAAELEALAASSPEGKEAYEAFRPLGADFQARMVALASAELKGAAPVEPVIAPPVEPDEQRSRLLFFRRAVRRVEVRVGAVAAAAASLLFLIIPLALPPLPAYTVDPLIGNQTSRGGEPSPASGPPVFAPGSPLRIVIHPLKSVQGSLDPQPYLEVPGGGKVGWVPIPGFRRDLGAGGTVRLDGTLGETIQLPFGTWRICVVVSRPGKAPQARQLPAALRTKHADWQVACTDSFKTVSSGIRQPALANGSGVKVDP